MTPSESFAQWRPDTLVPSHQEAYEAGWNACAAFYDGKSSLPLGGGEDYTSVRTPFFPTAEDIYAIWPVKKGRGAAIPAIKKAMKKVAPECLYEAVNAFSHAFQTWPAEDRQYCPMCSTFMNQERWLDDRSTWRRGTAQQTIRTAN